MLEKSKALPEAIQVDLNAAFGKMCDSSSIDKSIELLSMIDKSCLELDRTDPFYSQTRDAVTSDHYQDGSQTKGMRI